MMCDMLTNIFNTFSPLVKSFVKLPLLVLQLFTTIFIGFDGSPEEPGETRREAGDDDDYERAVVSQSEILTYMFVGFLFVAIGE